VAGVYPPKIMRIMAGRGDRRRRLVGCGMVTAVNPCFSGLIHDIPTCSNYVLGTDRPHHGSAGFDIVHHQRQKTLEAVARDAELKLAETKARSESDEARFAQMAQTSSPRRMSLFLQRANETFKRHKEGTQSQSANW
jgi:hypothetical protein